MPFRGAVRLPYPPAGLMRGYLNGSRPTGDHQTHVHGPESSRAEVSAQGKGPVQPPHHTPPSRRHGGGHGPGGAVHSTYRRLARKGAPPGR
eukprot:4547999-Pleurochrysis_carterae.AAC.1